MGSQCTHRALTCALRSAPFALTVHKTLNVGSPCTHRSFSVHLSLGQIFYLGWTIHSCTLYVIVCLITDKRQCKNNSRGTRNKTFIVRSHSVNISFTFVITVHFLLAFALCLRYAFDHSSPFIRAHQILFSVRSSFDQIALTVCSPFSHRSSGKVERFMDFTCL